MRNISFHAIPLDNNRRGYECTSFPNEQFSDKYANVEYVYLISVLRLICKSYTDSLVQNCSISRALAMETVRSCMKLSIWHRYAVSWIKHIISKGKAQDKVVLT